MVVMVDHEVILQKPAKSDIKKFLIYLDSKPQEDVVEILSKQKNNKLYYNINLLSTNQSISLIDDLLNRLHSWVSKFDDDALNVSSLQGISWLLCTILSNCRLLCPSVPRAAVVSFQSLLERMREELATFGSVILNKTHVRGVMQSFLRLCHIWGDLNSLTQTTDAPPSTCSDATLPDLSITLPFLSKHQWSVVTERISNFGDQLCNRLLMQLWLQKLEIAQYCFSYIPCPSDPTTKYIVERFSPYLHESVDSVMTPEQLNMVVNGLPDETVTSFVTLLFTQILEGDDKILEKWTKDPVLLENQKFIAAILEAALKSLVDFYKTKVGPESKKFHKNLQALNIRTPGDLNTLRQFINECMEAKRPRSAQDLEFAVKVCNAIAHLPFSRLSTDNCALMYCAGTMVCLDLGDQLLPIFERLLVLSADVTACFDIGLMITWIGGHVTDRSSRCDVTELLVKNGTNSDAGMKQFKTLVKSLKRGSSCLETSELLETQVNLHVSIRKCWREKKDPASIEYNSVLASQRERLNKRVRATLDGVQLSSDTSPHDWLLLDAFTIDLQQRYRESNGKPLAMLNFSAFLEKALTCMKTSADEDGRKSSLNLLTTVLHSVKSLRSSNNKELVLFIYQRLSGCTCPDVLWEGICKAATLQEMKKIMDSVVQGVLPTLSSNTTMELNLLPKEFRPLQVQEYLNNKSKSRWSDHNIHVWGLFLRKAEGDKLTLCCDAVKKLLAKPECTAIVTDDVLDGSYLKWFKFLHFIATHQKIPRSARLEKYLLHVVLTIPADLPHNDYFACCVDIVTVLVSSKRSKSIRYPPIVFLAFRRLLEWLLERNEMQDSVQAAFLLEKLVGMFVQRKEELRLEFFLQEIIRGIVAKEMHTQVKMHVKNCAFALLRGLDDKNCASLQVSLPPGCREVFKSIHIEYRKFYKFRGKV